MENNNKNIENDWKQLQRLACENEYLVYALVPNDEII